MKAQKVALTEQKQAPTTGNIYFEAKLNLKNKDGNTVEREVRLVVNPRWKGAYEEAIEKAERCTMPSFNLYVQNMERRPNDYNGTGSTWARKVGGEDGSEHVGTFNFQGTQYTLEVTRADATQDFELSLTELEPVSLTQL